MSSTKLAIKNTLWLFGEKGVAMSLSLLVSTLLARYLQPEGFGTLNYLSAFLSLLIPFAALGLNALVTRELVTQPERNGTILASALCLRLAGACLALVLLSIGLLVLPKQQVLPDYWLILAALANAFTAAYLFDFYFQAIVASRYVVKVRLTVLVFASSAKLLAIYYSASLPLFLAIVLLEPIAIGLLLWLAYLLSNRKTTLPISPWSVDKTYSLFLLNQSKWLILSGFMAVIYLKIDLLMLGQLTTAAEVGFYAVAVRLSEVWYFFPSALVVSFFPRLLKLKASSGDASDSAYYKQLQKLCDLLFGSALLLVIVVSLLASPVIILLFGEQYQPSVMLLQIHIWAGIFIFMRALLSKWLIAEHLLKFSLLTHGIAAVVNVLLNYYWIPLYGGQGAAWATLISYATSSYFVLWFNKSTRPMAWVMTQSIVFPVRLIKRVVLQ